MKEKSIRRLEKLEGRAGINDEELTIIIKAVGTDENRNRIITGGVMLLLELEFRHHFVSWL